jgi:hypothetical protein
MRASSARARHHANAHHDLTRAAARAMANDEDQSGHRNDLLELQKTAGNQAIAQMLAGGHGPLLAQRDPAMPGWEKADTRAPQGYENVMPGGWNATTREVGAIRRVPIDGLHLGNQEAFKDKVEGRKTIESAAGRAIVLIPPGIHPGMQVDVLFHLHGYSNRESDPHAGWRQHSTSGTVRDVDQDRIEAQLEAAKTTQLIAVMPQGIGSSEFGKLPVNDYVAEVLGRLAQVGEPPPKSGAGSQTTSGPLKPSRLILSAHSGGGDRIAPMLSESTGRNAAEVILFEAIHVNPKKNWDGVKPVVAWAKAHLQRVQKILANPNASQTARADAIAACPIFRGYYSTAQKGIRGSGGYAATYQRLERELDALFTPQMVRDLGPDYDTVKARFKVQGITGANHETIVRGLGDDPEAGPLADALLAMRPTGAKTKAPDKLATKGSTTWISPGKRTVPTAPGSASSTAPVGPGPGKPAVPAPVSVPAPISAVPTSALGPDRIIEIASRHGLGGFGMLSAMPIVFRGGDPLRILADLLVLAGMRDSVDVTDVLFEVVHPELGGGRIPEGEAGLVADWVALRKRFANPAVAAAKAAATPATPPATTGTATPAGPAGTTAPTTGAPEPTDAGTAPTEAPAQAPVGGTTYGAKEMDPEKRKTAIEGAVKQATKAGESDDLEAIQAVFVASQTTTDAWFGDLVPNATFLDVPIRPSGGTVPGVHRKLDDKLRKAEERLVKQFPTLTKAQIAKKMGIYEISGMRPPKKATGGSLPSYHCFGLAVDINHPTNPFVGNKKPVKTPKMTAEQLVKYQEFMQNRSPRIIERAMLLIRNRKFDIEDIAVPKGPGTRAGRLWEVHHEASEALAEYLSLASDLDGRRLHDLVDALRKSGDTRDLDWWKQRISDDRVVIKPWDFMQHKAPEKTGYMDLAKELVEALAAAGLEWGGGYGGAKDMMHFDLRDGSITRPDPKKKKK